MIFPKTKNFFLILLMTTSLGCPVTCVVRPFNDDILTKESSILIEGLTIDQVYDGENIITSSLPRTTVLGGAVFFQESLADYEESGTLSYSIETTSDDFGFFRLPVEFFGAGQYRVSLDPLSGRPPLLVFSRPDLEFRENQYVWLDWTTEESLILGVLSDFFSVTLSGSESPESLALLAEVETERLVDQYYGTLRIFIADEASDEAQTVRMQSCDGGITRESCNDSDLGAYGRCGVDYPNADLSGGACRVYVPMILSELYPGPGTLFGNGYLSSEDPAWVRVSDVGRALAPVAAHELAHALGLVRSTTLFGSEGWNGEHNPSEPSFLASYRQIPLEFMGGDPSTSRVTQLVEDCNPLLRTGRDPDDPIVRCPHRWSQFNRDYLYLIQGGREP